MQKELREISRGSNPLSIPLVACSGVWVKKPITHPKNLQNYSLSLNRFNKIRVDNVY
jgi:hypothetical protein